MSIDSAFGGFFVVVASVTEYLRHQLLAFAYVLEQFLDRRKVHPVRTVDQKVVLVFSPCRGRRHDFRRQILPERGDSQLVGIGLAEGDLSFK